mgnify:CR=1 FL=1
MTYQFKCIYCNEIKEIEKGMNEPFPDMIFCKKNHLMFRDYSGEAGSKSVIIPDSFRSVK